MKIMLLRLEHRESFTGTMPFVFMALHTFDPPIDSDWKRVRNVCDDDIKSIFIAHWQNDCQDDLKIADLLTEL